MLGILKNIKYHIYTSYLFLTTAQIILSAFYSKSQKSFWSHIDSDWARTRTQSSWWPTFCFCHNIRCVNLTLYKDINYIQIITLYSNVWILMITYLTVPYFKSLLFHIPEYSHRKTPLRHHWPQWPIFFNTFHRLKYNIFNNFSTILQGILLIQVQEKKLCR